MRSLEAIERDLDSLAEALVENPHLDCDEFDETREALEAEMGANPAILFWTALNNESGLRAAAATACSPEEVPF